MSRELFFGLVFAGALFGIYAFAGLVGHFNGKAIRRRLIREWHRRMEEDT